MLNITPKKDPVSDHWDEVLKQASRAIDTGLKDNIKTSLGEIGEEKVTVKGSIEDTISVKAVLDDEVYLDDFFKTESIQNATFMYLTGSYANAINNAAALISGRHPEDDL